MKGPAHAGVGGRWPQDCLARVLLKPGHCRGGLCRYEDGTSLGRKVQASSPGSDVSPSSELGVRPLCSTV